MVHCEIVYEGSLRTRATHGPSGDTLITDAPVDNRGKGETFSPTDLVGVALGTCVLTLMGIAANDMGRDLEHPQAQVKKTMKATPVRHIARLTVDVELGGTWTQEERIVLEKAALDCPVRASLGDRVNVEMTFHWRG
ncbi:MAG: OsmC family protein [Planctomycetes bacterium]|nr:OsmC family protein [Planctomycetota bacterium]MCB9909159.1 OsmC family protein [Planctomycetota bacterium]HPF15765.1 OsmC family protein [Planctomycetota bacterium]HRV82931.1 OsmC family protein [Planctomycetota bacterium]